jgi:large subunit ribosomal protein L18
MYRKKDRRATRMKIRRRIRSTIQGTPERPRLAVFRSLKHISVQAVDDTVGRTVAAASSLDRECKTRCPKGGNIEAAKVVGEVMASRLKAKGLEQAVFDRGGYRYHGRVRALAEALREGGLTF